MIPPDKYEIYIYQKSQVVNENKGIDWSWEHTNTHDVSNQATILKYVEQWTLNAQDV